MAQRYDKLKFIELCFFDDGITISGSYKKHLKLVFDGLQAIEKAINGLSTKEPVAERGWGVGESVKLVSESMKGEIMIVSSNGISWALLG